MNIPPGYSTVTPYFIVVDADAFVVFLEQAFGGRDIGRHLRPDGKIASALACGGKLEMPVCDKPYGDRQGGVIDPHGNIWWVSQRLVAGPYT